MHGEARGACAARAGGLPRRIRVEARAVGGLGVRSSLILFFSYLTII